MNDFGKILADFCWCVLLLLVSLSTLVHSRSLHIRSTSDRWSSPCSVDEQHPHLDNATMQETLIELMRSTARLQDILFPAKSNINMTFFQEQLYSKVKELKDTIFNFSGTPDHPLELTEDMYRNILQLHYKAVYHYLEHVEHVCETARSIAVEQTLCAPETLVDDVMTSLYEILCHIKIGLKGAGVTELDVPRVGLSSEFLKHDTNHTYELVRLYILVGDGHDFARDLNDFYAKRIPTVR